MYGCVQISSLKNQYDWYQYYYKNNENIRLVDSAAPRQRMSLLGKHRTDNPSTRHAKLNTIIRQPLTTLFSLITHTCLLSPLLLVVSCFSTMAKWDTTSKYRLGHFFREGGARHKHHSFQPCSNLTVYKYLHHVMISGPTQMEFKACP